MATGLISREDPYDYQREQSPATSFLDKFALGALPEDRDGKVNNRPSEEAWDNHTLKRSAASREELQQQASNKRIRHDNHSLLGYKSCRYADAATQTELLETPTARLAQLREEELAAKAKHEAQMAMAQARFEAEVAQRRQIMAEIEYQSKMAAWRQLSEVSANRDTTPARPTATGSASVGMSDSIRQYPTKKTDLDTTSTAKEHEQSISRKAKTEESPKHETPKIHQATKAETPTTRANGLVKHTSAPDTSKANGPVKRTAPDASRAAPSSPARGRADSSRGHSVQMKTSPSPRSPANSRARPQVDIPWAPSSQLKHLTCYFWKNTAGCNKSAAECNYAHYDTGVTASDPEHLRRYKRW
ncbi:MAG: hypothetical protein LQ337_002180 [Flavoplaca oasis]|nr:MAG: hypothetical protein LQ337_002180 [Flavoplaca oasis]